MEVVYWIEGSYWKEGAYWKDSTCGMESTNLRVVLIKKLFCYTGSAVVEGWKVIKKGGNRNRFSLFPYLFRKWEGRVGCLFDILAKGMDVWRMEGAFQNMGASLRKYNKPSVTH